MLFVKHLREKMKIDLENLDGKKYQMLTRNQYKQQKNLAAKIKIDIENLNEEKYKIIKRKWI